MNIFWVDRILFYWINHAWANPVLDLLMPFITAEESWFVPGLLLIGYLIGKGGRKGRLAILVLGVTIGISDQISSSLLKPAFHRERPCQALPDVRLLDRCGKSYSFPSSHATNSFAAATLFARFYPAGRWIYFGVAALVALSRPYVGVHYPGDVVAGALLGWGIGWLVWWCLQAAGRRWSYLGNLLTTAEAEEKTDARDGKQI